MQEKTQYTVIGAGHGGKAMAAHLALRSFPVTLYNRTPENIAVIQAKQGIELESFDGGPHGFAELDLATSNIAAAVQSAEVVMVVVPSTAHASIACATAPHLRDGQIIILHPGRTGGALEFVQVLRQNNCRADITLAETETLIYASRSDGPAHVRILSIK